MTTFENQTHNPIGEMRVALIQEPPVFLNGPASLDKAVSLIDRAVEAGAQLVVFPETWLPGYPVWLDNSRDAAMWNNPGAKALYRILCDNALVAGSAPFDSLKEIARKKKVHIVMGCHELDGNTLYNTMFFFSGFGREPVAHRKLMPTYNEKLIWGQGDGSTLNTLDSQMGPIGGLVCWEHWMPLARAAMHAKKEVIHVAQWPSVIELHQMASRHYAFEGRCFVLACGTVLSKGEVLAGFDSLGLDEPEAREMLASIAQSDADLLMTGGSAVIGPGAEYIVLPEYETQTILYADLDQSLIREAAMVLDTDGHYGRPDIFSLTVNETPMASVEFSLNK